MHFANDSCLHTDQNMYCCRHGNFVREISYLPLALDIPVAFNSCRKGPRSLEWRSDKPAELAWIEAQVHSRQETSQTSLILAACCRTSRRCSPIDVSTTHR